MFCYGSGGAGVRSLPTDTHICKHVCIYTHVRTSRQLYHTLEFLISCLHKSNITSSFLHFNLWNVGSGNYNPMHSIYMTVASCKDLHSTNK